MLVSESSFDKIRDFNVLSRSESDHLPLSVTVEMKGLRKMKTRRNHQNIHSFVEIKWSVDGIDSYHERLNSDVIQQLLYDIDRVLDAGYWKSGLQMIHDVIWYCCESMRLMRCVSETPG